MKRASLRLFAVLTAFTAISQMAATPADDFRAHGESLVRSFLAFSAKLDHVPHADSTVAWIVWTGREKPEIAALLQSAVRIAVAPPAPASPNLGGPGPEAVAARADYPNWWINWGLVNSSTSLDSYALVNQGQLKSFAAKAVQEFDADLASFGGAGTTLHALVASWQNDYTRIGHLKPADFQAVDIGQLKNIGNLFYSRLVQVGYTNSPPFWLAPNPSTDNLPGAVGQLKAVFSFDVTLDADADGFPDLWEMHYFGHLGVDPNADPCGDGETNLQKFLDGADPSKPLPPVLTITRGDGQTGGAGGYVPRVLTVRLTRGQQPVANASITFTVTQGGGQVQATRTSVPSDTLAVSANSSGIARVFFRLPNTLKTICKVAATGAVDGAQTSVLFTESAGDSTYTVQKEACSVANVQGALNPDGSQDITWENNTDEPTPIFKRESDRSLTQILTVPAGRTSVHLAPGQ